MATQTIETVLALKDQMTAGLNKAGNTLGGFGKTTQGALGKMSDLSGSATNALSNLGLVGTVGLASIGTAVYKAIDAVSALNEEGKELNRSFENTSIRIAGTLKAFDVAPTFAKAQAQAAGVMGTVADLAAKLPGETEDYISVFATALPKAIAAGMTDMQEVAKFTSYWTAVASSNMVDAGQAGMDLFRILSGQAGADVRMWTVLAEKIGMTTEAFNKLAAAERLAKIQEAIGAFDAQLIAAGDTFDAKAGEFESRLKEIKRVGTELSFDMAKKSLDEMNDKLKENRAELTYATETLTGFFEFLKDGTKGLLLDIQILSAKLLNTMSATNAELGEMRSVAAEPSDIGAKYAKAQADQLRARQARITEFETAKFAEVEKLLPPALQKGLGPTGFASPKLLPELIKLGKARKDDVTTVQRIADYIEFMKLGDADLIYATMTGRGVDLSKTQKAEREKAERERTKKPKLAKAEHHFDFRNSRFDIKQEFAEGFDPDRIAVAFAQDLGRAGEMRTQSMNQQAWVGR